ncbi:MAG: FAD-dependent oxidoreductase [Oscillospiraceae bacterium]|nr:FAD-dependent oxidoreductase [Oscillospiraceae bacterium]
MEHTFDAAVIGAGPAGLSAAINLSQRGKSVIIYGSENLLARAEKVDNYLGLPGLNGTQLMDTFLNHVKKMQIPIKNAKVANIMPFDDTFMANVNGEILSYRTIVYAGGVAKAKELPGEAQFLGNGVSYCATCDGMLYRGKTCVVWGNAKDAVEEANFLAGIGVNVNFVAAKQPAALTDTATFVAGALKAIEGENKVSHAVLADGTRLPCDGVFLLRAAIAPDKLIAGLELTDGYVNVTRSMSTNIPGFFACGDCTGTPLQVSKAVGEGLIAGLAAAEYLDQD